MLQQRQQPPPPPHPHHNHHHQQQRKNSSPALSSTRSLSPSPRIALVCQRCRTAIFDAHYHHNSPPGPIITKGGVGSGSVAAGFGEPGVSSLVESFVWLRDDFGPDQLDSGASVSVATALGSNKKRATRNFSDASKKIEIEEELERIAFPSSYLTGIPADDDDQNHDQDNTKELCHPLCITCTEKMLKKLEDELVGVTNEANHLENATVELENSLKLDGSTRRHKKQAEEEVLLQEEERRLLVELERAKQDLQIARSERQKQEAEEREKIDELESKYFDDFNTLLIQHRAFTEERDLLLQKKATLRQELQQLRETNLYNDAFCIWYDGQYGTINGMRLGSVSVASAMSTTSSLEWPEINAGLGHAALLLHTLAEAKRFSFSQWRIVPMGSTSKLKKSDGSLLLDLFGSSGGGGLFSRGTSDRFEKGMTAFLECLREFGTHVEQQDSNFHVPYQISENKIGGCPIIPQSSSPELWTQALKYMLTNLKWLLSWVWVSTHSHN